jgi:hypothetical protein
MARGTTSNRLTSVFGLCLGGWQVLSNPEFLAEGTAIADLQVNDPADSHFITSATAFASWNPRRIVKSPSSGDT